MSSRTELRVNFGDTDAMGIVYYANYLRFFEAGRGDLLRKGGLPYRDLFDRGVMMPVVEQWWRYRAPARFDDEIVVTTWIHEVGHASLLVGGELHRDSELLGQGAVRLACTGRDGRPVPLPEEIRRVVAP